MAENLAKAFTEYFWYAAQEIQGSVNANLPKLVERVPALGMIVPGGGDAGPREEDADVIDAKERLAITATGDVASSPPGGGSDTAAQQEPVKDKGD